MKTKNIQNRFFRFEIYILPGYPAINQASSFFTQFDIILMKFALFFNTFEQEILLFTCL